MFNITETTIIEKLEFPAVIIDKLSCTVVESNQFFNYRKNCQIVDLLKMLDKVYADDAFIRKLQFALNKESFFRGILVDSLTGLKGMYSIHAHCISSDRILIYMFPIGHIHGNLIETNAKWDVDQLDVEIFKNRIVGDTIEGIAIINEKFIISFCNNSFGNIFECKSEDLNGENFLSIVGQYNLDFVKEELDNNKVNMNSSFELRLVNENFHEKYVSVFARPRMGSSKTYHGSYITMMDISEKVALERELIQSKEKARESEQLKSAFLANMSHEIRTPMNNILGFSSMLKFTKVSKDKRDKYLDVIISHSKKLMDLITDIIDITIIEENQVKIILAPTNLNGIINDLISKSKLSIQEVGKSIKLQKRIGLIDKDSIIFTDSYRIKQIFSYIINNAIKFTDEGVIEIGYRIENNETLLLFVRDTGIGIEPSKQQLIFERFRQVDESFTRLYGGTGLGLTIAKELVKLFGGQIWVESDGVHGSTFYFTLPYNKYSDYHKDIMSNDMKKSVNWKNKNILVIEDDIPSSEFLSEILLSRGCKVFQAINGNEGLTYFKNNKIDLVLLDIQLPEMDGYEIAQELRILNATVPIIAQTARAFAEDREKCILAGCNDYITKPIPYNVLVSTISEYLDKV